MKMWRESRAQPTLGFGLLESKVGILLAGSVNQDTQYYCKETGVRRNVGVVAFLTVVLSVAVAPRAVAQCPTFADPFFQSSSVIGNCPFQPQPPFTMSWSASTTVPSPVYEVLLATYAGRCELPGAGSTVADYAYTVVGTTTATSFQLNFPSNVVWVTGVRVKGCSDPNFIRVMCLSDSFESLPGKPTILSASATTPGEITVQVSIPDDTAGTILQRAGTDGVFRTVSNVGVPGCPPGSVQPYTDYGNALNRAPGTLPPGAYRYRLRRTNNSYFSTGPNLDPTKIVYSDEFIVATPPRVAVSAFPAGMLQAAGAATATDSFAVTNIGGTSATMTLLPAGNFFSISPASFTLDAGATQVVTIRATAQQAGLFDGTVSISGSGIPSGLVVFVRLLSAAPPTAPVRATSTTPRAVVSAPVGETPTGTFSFTNNGSVTLQGIIVADVPWIIHPREIITIAPGETKTFTFSVDRSLRPDAASLVGGIAGKISLVFLSGSGSSLIASVTPNNGSSGTSSVSVTVVDVVKPGVTAGAPPPLAANQIALFIPGLSSKTGSAGDLLLANRSVAPSLNDLRIFFTSSPTGTPSQSSALSALLPDVGVTFPSIMQTVFGAAASANVQVRSAQANSVSVNAVQVATASDGTYGTALPVFRSSGGVGAGDSIVLAGVLKSAGASHTDVYVQEVSGNTASIQLTFFDTEGREVSSRAADIIGAFGFLELPDVVSANASTVRVSNLSTGAAKIAAYARIVLEETGDSLVITDNVKTATPSGTLIVPTLFAGGPGARSANVMAVNRTTAPVSVTMEQVAIRGRRRATRGTTAGGSSATDWEPEALQNATIGALQMLQLTITSGTNGFVRITAPAGAVAASGRSTTNNRIGTGLPAFALTSALGSGGSTRFIGIDDSSAATVAAATAATYRSNLILIEPTGQSATVRVILRFVFPAGITVAGRAEASKEFAVYAGQMTIINDLAKSVIGSQRDSFGDLRNMQVIVEVTGGSGKVIPLIQSIENATGDVILRD